MAARRLASNACCAPLLLAHRGVICWLWRIGMLLILLVFFYRTLLPDKETLCTRFARTVHAPLELTPRHECARET
jgi:hypothetical protein